MVEKSPLSALWPSLYDPLRQLGARFADFLAPAADASASEKAYTIRMELPGVNDDDISLTVDNGVVSVKGEKKTEREEKGDTWYFTERQYGSFQRSFSLPSDADANGVNAALKDGVLTITIPRKEPKAKEARTVKIARS